MRKKRIASLQAGELNLTAMIDVAFQLLSFFVMTMVPTDVLAQIDVTRPSPPPPGKIISSPLHPISITVLPNDSYVLNDRSISKENLNNALTTLGATDPEATIIVSCTPKSTHGKMVEVLDICAKAKLTSLSVVSLE